MPQKLFSSEFFNALISSETSNRFSLSDYFETAYTRTYDFCESLPYLLSRREVSVTSPFSYETANLDAFCLIHTTKGIGKLFCDTPTQINAAYELTKGTLAFIDCHKQHKLTCLHNIWEYTICFVSSPISSYFHKKLETLGGCIFKMDSNVDTRALWEQLLKLQTDDETYGLMRSHALIALYTQLYLSRSKELAGSYHIPSYIADMKQKFDNAYDKQYSLDELSLKYNINKYRLCREFAKYYHDTPLQYLNNIRIEQAKNLLLHSDEKIGVISQMVGIENANHFIRLFKEKTGITPLTYRRETPIIS
ncbi:MAG: helix-turn-helix transcriptional regulator [Lachnospiraceae bacterium]|nr:helix-turn-helix transcriptional regulator [Lachnospiraceae bacterium]